MKQITIKKILILTIILFFSSTALFAGGSKESDVVDSKVTNKKDSTVMNFCKKTSIMFDDITESLCKSVSPFPSVIDNFSIPSNPNSLIDYSLYNTQLKEKERTAWNYTSRMFTLFLTLEIIVLAIKKYLQGNDDLLKEVIIKIVVCFFLVIFLSLTPYILELFKTGLQYSASVVTRSNITYSPTAVFELPGELIRAQSSLVASISFDNLSSLLTNIDPTKDVTAGYLISILFNILYAFCRIFAMILVIIMALHIMLNIVEVYLILAVCMCLVPMSVFSLTKHLGEKALPCLFNNIMELCVIFVIYYAMGPLLQDFASFSVDAIDRAMPVAQIIIIPPEVAEDSQYSKEVFNDFCRAFTEKDDSKMEDVNEAVEVTIFRKWLQTQSNLTPRDGSDTEITKISQLSNSDIFNYKDYLLGEVSLGLLDKSSIVLEDCIKVTDALGPGVASLCFMHLMTFLITIYITFSFIKRSSEITNSILSGNVSVGDTTAAIGLAMLAAKKAVQIGMGVSGFGINKGRGGVGWAADKARAKNPNSRIAAMTQWASKSNMYKEMKREKLEQSAADTLKAISKP